MDQPKIYLDISRNLRESLRNSGLTLQQVLQREGVTLPIEILPEELPAPAEGEHGKDIGTVLMASAGLTLSMGVSASMVILALSKFFKDREQAPVVVANLAVKEITAPNGETRKVLVPQSSFIQPDTVKSAAELEGILNLKDGVTVRMKTEESPID